MKTYMIKKSMDLRGKTGEGTGLCMFVDGNCTSTGWEIHQDERTSNKEIGEKKSASSVGSPER